MHHLYLELESESESEIKRERERELLLENLNFRMASGLNILFLNILSGRSFMFRGIAFWLLVKQSSLWLRAEAPSYLKMLRRNEALELPQVLHFIPLEWSKAMKRRMLGAFLLTGTVCVLCRLVNCVHIWFGFAWFLTLLPRILLCGSLRRWGRV